MNKKRDLYAYSNDIFDKDNNLFFKKNVSSYFSRLNEENYIFNHKIKLNNLKFRSDEDFNNNGEDIYKIVVLGDSYVAGFDVENYWVKELNKLLNDKISKKIKIYNLGIPGTGPINWIKHKKTIEMINPDFLIIGLINNIFLRPLINIYIENNTIITEYEKKDVLFKGLLIENLDKLTKEEIKYYHNKYNQLIKNELIDFPILDLNFFERNKKCFEELIEITSKTLIIQMPTYETFSMLNFYDNIQYKYINDLNNKNNNINFINAINYINYEISKDDIYIKSGSHFNDKGNKLISEIILSDILNINNKHFYTDILDLKQT